MKYHPKDLYIYDVRGVVKWVEVLKNDLRAKGEVL